MKIGYFTRKWNTKDFEIREMYQIPIFIAR